MTDQLFQAIDRACKSVTMDPTEIIRVLGDNPNIDLLNSVVDERAEELFINEPTNTTISVLQFLLEIGLVPNRKFIQKVREKIVSGFQQIENLNEQNKLLQIIMRNNEYNEYNDPSLDLLSNIIEISAMKYKTKNLHLILKIVENYHPEMMKKKRRFDDLMGKKRNPKKTKSKLKKSLKKSVKKSVKKALKKSVKKSIRKLRNL